MPVRASVQWEIPPLPIVKDAQVGVIKVTDHEGRFIKEAPLLAEQPLLPSLWYSYKKVWLGLGLSSMLLDFLANSEKNSTETTKGKINF